MKVLIQPTKEVDGKLRLRDDIEMVQEALKASNSSIRYNNRSNRFEILIDGQMPHQDYGLAHKVLTLHLRNNVFVAPREDGNTPTKLKQVKSLSEADLHFTKIALDNEYDPFIEWLESLPEWDGVDRVETFMLRNWNLEDNEFNRWVLRYIFVCPIVRAFRPGFPAKRTPILFGPQNSHKSWYVKNILPENFQTQWFGEIENLSSSGKELAENLQGRVITELSELGGSRKAEVDKLKSFLSREDDGMSRMAYAKNVVSLPRKTGLVGTANNDVAHIPSDKSGTARFACVDIMMPEDLGKLRLELVEQRSQMWAESLHKYREGSIEWTDPYPYGQDEHWDSANEDFKKEDGWAESLESLIIFKRPFTIGQIVKAFQLNMQGKPTQHYAREALLSLGYDKPDNSSHYKVERCDESGVSRWYYPEGWTDENEHRDKKVNESLRGWM